MSSDRGAVPRGIPRDEAVAAPRGNALFITCFAALVATSFCFVLRAFVIDDWGHEFGLSATQKGELLGVGLWPFSISIVLLSLLIDRVGFRAVLWFAVACHLVGTVVIVLGGGYWALYMGTFVLSLGNGAVEAAVNPLIATAYRHDKTKWLNMLHAGWPGVSCSADCWRSRWVPTLTGAGRSAW